MSSQAALPPLTHFKYNTVKILSIQQTDNKIRILKMVRRKVPTAPSSSIIIDSDDEDKENIIEIADSDDEGPEASKSLLEVGNLNQEKIENAKTKENPQKCSQEVESKRKTIKFVRRVLNTQNLPKRVKNTEDLPVRVDEIAKELPESDQKAEKERRNIQNVIESSQTSHGLSERVEITQELVQIDEKEVRNTQNAIESNLNTQEQVKSDQNTSKVIQDHPKPQKRRIDIQEQAESLQTTRKVAKRGKKFQKLVETKQNQDDQLKKIQTQEEVLKKDSINTENSEKMEFDQEITDPTQEKSSNELKIIESTSLSDSKDLIMQDLLIEFQNDEKTPQKQNFMETVDLKAPENDKNNNSTAKDGEKGKSREFLSKLKCYKGCYSSKTHQKKHKIDFSSPVGLLLSKRDKIDENYLKTSLKRLEDNCKTPKIDNYDQFMHSTRSGKVSKAPRGRFGKQIQPSEVLAMMKDAGRERSFAKRKF